MILKRIKTALYFLSLVFLFSISSCDVGLGEAVDTEPPTVEISSPLANDKIRGSFTMSGTCSDEQGVKSVEIQLVSLDDSSSTVSYYPGENKFFKASLKEEGTKWECVIDPKTNQIPDGSYEASVVVIDKAGRNSRQKKSFSIDNTPPLVVLTRPSAKSTDLNPDSYGQKFVIEGQASDDSGIDLLEVEIYSKEENPKLLKTVQLKNVPLSININVAEFKDEIYTEIYGDNIEEGKKDYFCKIKAYDGTKKVPALQDDDKKGNLSDSYYLYNDIYSSVLSKYKINEVYQILSGTYKESENRSGESEKSVFETVKENLSKHKIDSGFFSLNPRNNPSYILSGYEALLCDGNDFSELKYHIPNGTKVSLRLTSGLDNTPLVDDTLGVSAFECDDYAKVLDGAEEIVLVPALKDKDGNVLLTDENSINERASSISAIGSTARNISFVLDKSDGKLKIGSKYIIKAVGVDENKNESYVESPYGFMLVSNGAAPKISVEEPSDSVLNLKRGSSFKIKGSSYHDEGCPTVIIKANDKIIYSSETTSFETQVNISDIVADENVSGEYSVYVYSSYNGMESTYKEKTVFYDVEAPEISINSVIPLVEDAERKNNVNGIISVRGSIVDSFTSVVPESAEYEVYDNGKKIESLSGKIENPLNFYFTVDTSSLTDKTDLDVRILAEDKAGNCALYNLKDDFYFINQQTDKPVITLNSIGEKAFVRGSSYSGFITDDDNIDSVEFNLYHTDSSGSKGELYKGAPLKVVKNINSTQYNFSVNLPDSVNDFILEVCATDVKSDGSLPVSNTVSHKFRIAGDAPVLEVDEPKEVRYITTIDKNGAKTITFTGKVSGESNSLNPLTIQLLQGEDLDSAVVLIPSLWKAGSDYDGTETDWIGTTDAELFPNNKNEGTYRLYLKAVDSNGITSSKEIKFTVDNTKPSLSVTKSPCEEDGTIYIGNVSEFKIAGNAEDSNFNCVEYSYDGTNWTKFSESKAWTFVYTPDKTEEKTVFFRSVDKAGNFSGVVEKKIITIQNAPSISEIKVFADENEITSQNGTYYLNKDFKITGNVSYKHLKSFKCGEDDIVLSENSFEYNPSDNTKGLYEFKITDKADQYYILAVNVFYDKSEPEVEMTVSPVVEKNDKNNLNGTIKVSGTASSPKDKIAFTKLILNDEEVTDSLGEPVSDKGVVKQVYSDSGMRFTYEIDTTKYNNKSDLTIKILSQDRSGNKKEIFETFFVDQDTDKPVLSSSIFDFENPSQGEYKFGIEGNKITITAEDDDGVKEIYYIIKDKISSKVEKEDTIPGRNKTSCTEQIVLPNTLTLGKSYTIKFTVQDKNSPAVVYESPEIPFAYDKDYPVIKDIKIAGRTYENAMFVKAGDKISLSATDEAGIKEVSVVIKQGENEKQSFKLTQNGDSFESEGISGTDGDYTAEITAYDNFGRDTKSSLSFKIDTVLPEWKENKGTLENPNLVASDTLVSGGSKSKKHSELDSSFWFNQTAITLSGYAYDKNGIDKYSLKINDSEPVEISGSSSYKITSDLYKQGANEAVLTVYDKAGNFKTKTIFIQVDSASPSVTNAELKNSVDGKLITKEDSVLLTVETSDVTSGPEKILLSASADFSPSTEYMLSAISNNEVSFDIQSLSEGSRTLYVKAYDKSGLVSDVIQISGLEIDRTSPLVQYKTYSTGISTVNKTIKVEGTVSDEHLGSSPLLDLYYKKKTDGDWTKFGTNPSYTKSDEKSGSWSISVDTTQFTDDTEYNFQIRTKDLANNEITDSAPYVTVKILQDSDVPLIKLNSITTDGNSRLNTGTISGTAEDDDGISKMQIQLVSSDGTFNDSNWNDLSVENGLWSYEIPKSGNPSTPDGTYTLYFKVIDKENSTFETGKPSSPYISDTSSNKVNNPVSFSVDTTKPKISEVNVSFDGGVTSSVISNNQIFGGKKYSSALFTVKASDTVSKRENLSVKLNIDTIEVPLSYDSSSDVYTSSVDLTEHSSMNGNYSLIVTAEDEAKMTDTFQKSIIIDNTVPDTIRNVVPKQNAEVTGEFTMTGLIQDDETNSGISEEEPLKYYIPKYSEKDSEPSESISWTQENLSQTSVSWSIDFANLSERLGYNTSTSQISSDYRGFQDPSNSDLYNIPVWFRAVDKAGNIGYIKEGLYSGDTDSSKKILKLKFNPNADKPRVEINYPVHDKKDGTFNYVVLGGNVRFSGSATDNEGIDSVYLQFDFDGSGDFNTNNQAYSNLGLSLVSIPNKTEKGVKANGTVSWSYNLDISSLTGLSYETDKKVLRVRACAVDNDTLNGTLTSAWSEPVCISVNNSVPQIYIEKLRQYENSSSSNVVKEIDFNDGDFISGENWFLEGYCEDPQKIDIQNSSVSGSTTEANFNVIKDSEGNSDGKRVSFKIPVSSASGNWEVTLRVRDKDSGNPQSSERLYSLKIDNTPPSFKDGADANDLVLYKNGYGSDGTKIDNSGNYVQNSNGQIFTIASSVEEAGSGFKNAAVYFERYYQSEGKSRIFNVREEYGVDRRQNATEISSKQEGSVYKNAESLPVLLKTVTRDSVTTLSYAGLSSNKNIFKGSIVKLGGVYYKIINIEGDTVTIDGNCDTSQTSAEFVYAMIVDNNDNGSGLSDDGDLMAESYSKAGSKWIWDCSVNSANIPDGPVQIHVVVFDKAGNFKAGKVETRVTNNPVRITSVKLATDLNGNGAFDSSEYQDFYAIKNAEGRPDTSKGVDVWNLSTKDELNSGKNWTVRERLSVTPEFVGGTVPFYWNFSKNTQALSAPNKFSASDSVKISNKEEFILENSTLGAGDEHEGKDTYYSFSFWDSTEELTPGENTSWTVLNAHVKQEIDDNTAPSIEINPFYWESSSDNSLYKNSKENGHIELEKHLENGNFEESSGVYDKDPKLSGKVKIQGTANDNKILKEIFVKIPGFTASNGYISVAQYTKGSGWACDKTESDVDSSLSTKGFAFTIDSDEITQENGHTVTWTLIWDTSKISGVAKDDVKINFKATDQSSNSSGESSTQTTEGTKTSYYKVDVVPYITSVSRNVKYNNNRARSGAIPLLRDNANDEKGNYITGFNLGESIASDQSTLFGVSESKKGETLEINFSDTKVSVSNSRITFRVRSGTKDGYVSIKVNGILNLNNINDNSAEYNKENIVNQWFTDEWTDDRFVRIWQDNDVFGNDTLAKDIAYPAMAMSEDGVLYSSFTNYTEHKVFYTKTDGSTPVSCFSGYDAPEETTIFVKGSGSSAVVNVGYMGNYQSGGAQENWNPRLDAAGGYHVYDKNAKITYKSHKMFRFEQLFHNQKFQQFQNFRLVRVGTEANSYVHTAYYDKSTSSIHYSVAIPNAKLNGTDGADKSEFCWVNIDGGSDSDDTINFPYVFTSPTKVNHTVYSDSPNKNIVLPSSVFEDGMTRASSTSQFVGISLMPLQKIDNPPSPYPVIVYFAGDCIRVARANNDYPKGNESYWKVQRAVTEPSNKNYSMNYVTYVDCEIDSSGYLHIVFVNTSGELVYIKSTNNPSDGSKYKFDKPEVVTDGSPSCIDITTKGETPYIACISSINAVDGITMAFKSDGKWEVMKSPLIHTVAQNRACIEAHPNPATGWGEAAVGYYSNQDQRYHAAYYIGDGNGH